MSTTWNFGATSAIHSFRAYVMRNPFKAFSGMTNDDFDAMFNLFVAENAEINATPYFLDEDTSGTLSFPGDIDAADNQASADRANYPEKHRTG